MINFLRIQQRLAKQENEQASKTKYKTVASKASIEAVLSFMTGNPTTSTELANKTGYSQGTVSMAIKVLIDAGDVISRKLEENKRITVYLLVGDE
jgi:DNA-binding MarR family transcriptional regulator